MKKFHLCIRQVPVLQKIVYFVFRHIRFFFWKTRKNCYATDHPPENLLNRVRSVLSALEVENSNLSLVEVGCNSGALLFALAREFPSVTFLGIDLQISAIALAKTKAKEAGVNNISFLATDAREFSFKKPVDILVTSATLIYLDSDELPSFFEKTLPYVRKAFIINEIMSKGNHVYMSHYYAHPFRQILTHPMFTGFAAEFFPANHPPWENAKTTGTIILLTKKS